MPRAATTRRRALVAAAITAVGLVAAGLQSASRASTSTNELDAARQRLADMQAYFESVVAASEAARVELADIDARFAATERRVRRLAALMLESEYAAVSLAQELYKGGATSALEGVLSARSLADLDQHLTYLRYSGEQQTRVFEALAVGRAELTRRLGELETLRADAAATAAELDGLRAGVEAQVSELDAEVARLGAEAQAAQAAAAAARRALSSIDPSAPVPGPPYHADWDAIAMCESGGNWHLDSTYDGGLQFHPMTWLGYGGGKYAEYAWQATREQQIAIAEKVLAAQGPGAWPHCYQE